jgi:general secretion pathway protein B
VAATQANPTRAAPVEGARPVPAPLPPASAPEPRLRSLAELPEELRRSVPALAFGGSVYSETAAQRMVIFNGQVLREGDAVSDEVLLEQIRPQSAVMRLRGQRFEVKF